MKKRTLDLRIVLVAVLLGVLTLLGFSQVFQCDFVKYDDDRYVTNNEFVKAGLTSESVRWAFTATHEATWQPLIWLSYMLDIRLFGLNARGFHATNLILHIANVLLLFFVLQRMTRSLWKSAFVAALFAVHPLHVESVAWVAERKDVLSTLFWMLAMLAYLLYVERPSLGRYLPVVLIFALGLMAKPALVTLPFVLLLLDYWPLGRTQTESGRRTSSAQVFRRLVWEKTPLFALSVASSAITSVAQVRGASVAPLEVIPAGARVGNALVSYVGYLIKMLWPTKLAPFYPYPVTGLPAWQVAGSVVILLCLTIALMSAGRSRPYLAVGWLWYLGTLAPMIGIVQTGMHAMADRFTYVPLIGVFIMIAWGFPELLCRRVSVCPRLRLSLRLAAGLVIAGLAVLTWRQAGYWRDTISLFRHTTLVTKDNYIAHSNLGAALMDSGDVDGAIRELQESVNIAPLPMSYYNLGRALGLAGRFEESAAAYSESVQLEPGNPEARYNLAIALYKAGSYGQAWDEIRECRRLGREPHPGFVQALSQKMPDPGGRFDDRIDSH